MSRRSTNQLPASNCSRCFAPNPSYWYTFKDFDVDWVSEVFQTQVPLCGNCMNRIRLFRRTRVLLIIGLMIGAVLLWEAFISIIFRRYTLLDISALKISLVLIATLLVTGFWVGLFISNRIFDTKFVSTSFVEYDAVHGMQIRLRFKNRKYQALYKDHKRTLRTINPADTPVRNSVTTKSDQ